MISSCSALSAETASKSCSGTVAGGGGGGAFLPLSATDTDDPTLSGLGTAAPTLTMLVAVKCALVSRFHTQQYRQMHKGMRATTQTDATTMITIVTH